MHRHHPIPGRRRLLRLRVGVLSGFGAAALLLACAAPKAANADPGSPPDIGLQPGAHPPAIAAPPARAPALGPARPGSPATGAHQQPARAAPPAHAAPAGPAPPKTDSSAQRVDARLRREIERLRRVAEPRSGFGSTRDAANAAWTLGLIELHGGLAPGSPAQAQTWFERAARFGREPLAWAGLAWCAIDGCKDPPNPSAARQAIARLRPHDEGRALFLQWLLDTRLQPLTIGGGADGPEGAHSQHLPLRDLLESSASAGDSQARIELGIKAVANGELEAARAYFAAAAPRSRAAAADLELLELQLGDARQQPPEASDEAGQLFERAQRAHRGAGVPVNYVKALQLYRAAASKGSTSARRMLVQ